MRLTRTLAISAIVLGTAVLLLTTEKGSEVRKNLADKGGDMLKKWKKMPGQAMKKMNGVKKEAAEMMA